MNNIPGMGLGYTGSREIADSLGNKYLYVMPEFETDNIRSHIFKMTARDILFKMMPRAVVFKMFERLALFKGKRHG